MGLNNGVVTSSLGADEFLAKVVQSTLEVELYQLPQFAGYAAPGQTCRLHYSARQRGSVYIERFVYAEVTRLNSYGKVDESQTLLKDLRDRGIAVKRVTKAGE